MAVRQAALQLLIRDHDALDFGSTFDSNLKPGRKTGVIFQFRPRQERLYDNADYPCSLPQQG